MFGIFMSFRWAIRILSIFVFLVGALLHQIDIPVGYWLWNYTVFGFLPALVPIAGFFLLAWLWPGGK